MHRTFLIHCLIKLSKLQPLKCVIVGLVFFVSLVSHSIFVSRNAMRQQKIHNFRPKWIINSCHRSTGSNAMYEMLSRSYRTHSARQAVMKKKKKYETHQTKMVLNCMKWKQWIANGNFIDDQQRTKCQSTVSIFPFFNSHFDFCKHFRSFIKHFSFERKREKIVFKIVQTISKKNFLWANSLSILIVHQWKSRL